MNSACEQAHPATFLCKHKGLLLFGITCSCSRVGETPPCRNMDRVWIEQKKTSGRCAAGESVTVVQHWAGTCPPARARQQGLAIQAQPDQEQPSLTPPSEGEIAHGARRPALFVRRGRLNPCSPFPLARLSIPDQRRFSGQSALPKPGSVYSLKSRSLREGGPARPSLPGPGLQLQPFPRGLGGDWKANPLPVALLGGDTGCGRAFSCKEAVLSSCE